MKANHNAKTIKLSYAFIRACVALLTRHPLSLSSAQGVKYKYPAAGPAKNSSAVIRAFVALLTRPLVTIFRQMKYQIKIPCHFLLFFSETLQDPYTYKAHL